MTFILGCTMSLLTVQSLSAWLILSSMVAWAFVPFAQVVSLAAVRPMLREPIDMAVLVDRFFAGYAPWLLWLIGYAAFWSSVRTTSGFSTAFWIGASAAGAILVWSCYIDWCFFRAVSARPARSLVVQRMISWSMFAVVWAGGWLPAQIVGMVGL